MYKLTEKENLLRLLETGYPEYLPEYDFYGWGAGTTMFQDKKSPDGYILDEFGVEMTTSESSMGGFMPVPGRIFLKDIRKWRDVVKLPDLSGIDWERQAKKDMEGHDWVTKPVILHNLGYFMLLMNMMGFVDGLCAMEEEPEEVYALFDHVSGYFLEKEKALLKYYHGDIYELADDTAAMQFPFISQETYRKLVKPFAKREADLALNAGLKIGMHDCGKCESFIDDWLDIGVSLWEPAQVGNDLLAVQKKYHGRLTFAGGWDNQGAISFPDTPDEELAQAVRDYIDRYAPGGGFAFMAHVVGNERQDVFKRKTALVHQVYLDYGRDWYQRHGA